MLPGSGNRGRKEGKWTRTDIHQGPGKPLGRKEKTLTPSQPSTVAPADHLKTRGHLSAILEEIAQLTAALEKAGIACRQAEDREAKAIVKRMIMKAYGG